MTNEQKRGQGDYQIWVKKKIEAVVPLPRTSEAKEFVKINKELSLGQVQCEVQVRKTSRGFE